MDGTGLIGQASLLAQQGFKVQFFWATLGFVGALLLGAFLIAMLERWRKKPAAGLTAGDQLSHFRELYGQGLISKEEFDQIRARLAGELRKELNLESPAGASTAAPTAPAEGVQSPPEPTLPEPPAGEAPPR